MNRGIGIVKCELGTHFINVESARLITWAISHLITWAITLSSTGGRECVPGGRVCEERAPNSSEGEAMEDPTENGKFRARVLAIGQK